MVRSIGFEPIHPKELFYRQPTLSHLPAYAYIVSTSNEMPIVKYTTDHMAVVSAHRGYILYDPVFTTCVLTTGLPSPDTPSLLARCFLQCPAGSRSPSHFPNILHWFPTLLEPTKKPLWFPSAASLYKSSGYFLVVSRLLIEGSRHNRILFITACKPDPITGAETQ